MNKELLRITKIFLDKKLNIDLLEDDEEILEFLNNNYIEINEYVSKLHTKYKDNKGDSIKFFDFLEQIKISSDKEEYDLKKIKIKMFEYWIDIVEIFNLEDLKEIELKGIKGHAVQLFSNKYFLAKFEDNVLNVMMYPSGARYDMKETNDNKISIF